MSEPSTEAQVTKEASSGDRHVKGELDASAYDGMMEMSSYLVKDAELLSEFTEGLEAKRLDARFAIAGMVGLFAVAATAVVAAPGMSQAHPLLQALRAGMFVAQAALLVRLAYIVTGFDHQEELVRRVMDESTARLEWGVRQNKLGALFQRFEKLDRAVHAAIGEVEKLTAAPIEEAALGEAQINLTKLLVTLVKSQAETKLALLDNHAEKRLRESVRLASAQSRLPMIPKGVGTGAGIYLLLGILLFVAQGFVLVYSH